MIPSNRGMRKRDIAYLLFFITHLPIIFRMPPTSYETMKSTRERRRDQLTKSVIDTVPLQPSILQTNLSHQLRDFYITTYQDKFFQDPPAWFNAFVWMEVLYHFPASILAVRALWKGTNGNCLAKHSRLTQRRHTNPPYSHPHLRSTGFYNLPDLSSRCLELDRPDNSPETTNHNTLRSLRSTRYVFRPKW